MAFEIFKKPVTLLLILMLLCLVFLPVVESNLDEEDFLMVFFETLRLPVLGRNLRIKVGLFHPEGFVAESIRIINPEFKCESINLSHIHRDVLDVEYFTGIIPEECLTLGENAFTIIAEIKNGSKPVRKKLPSFSISNEIIFLTEFPAEQVFKLNVEADIYSKNGISRIQIYVRRQNKLDLEIFEMKVSASSGGFRYKARGEIGHSLLNGPIAELFIMFFDRDWNGPFESEHVFLKGAARDIEICFYLTDESGKPIIDCTIQVDDQIFRSSDTLGRHTLVCQSRSAHEKLHFTVKAINHLPKTVTVPISINQNSYLLDEDLRLQRVPLQLKIDVFDQSGNPIPGAYVQVTDRNENKNFNQTTDRNGYCEFILSFENYKDIILEIDALGFDAISDKVDLNDDILIQKDYYLPDASPLERIFLFKVVDSNGNKIRKVKVFINGKRLGKTNDRGMLNKKISFAEGEEISIEFIRKKYMKKEILFMIDEELNIPIAVCLESKK